MCSNHAINDTLNLPEAGCCGAVNTLRLSQHLKGLAMESSLVLKKKGKWCGDEPLCVFFPSFYALAKKKRGWQISGTRQVGEVIGILIFLGI